MSARRRGATLGVMVLAALVLSQGVLSMQERRVVTAAFPVAGPRSSAIVAGGMVYVSGLTGTGADGTLAGTDVQAQTRAALDHLKQVLEAAGSSLAQAVSVNVFLRRGADFDAMNTVYREYFSDAPPARTTVEADLADGALVAVSAIAVPTGAARETLLPATWMKSPRPYSYIVRANGLVFLSGLVSRRGTDDKVVPGPVSLQVRTILDNAGTLLKTAGLTYANVVAARVFLVDDSYFEPMNDEYRKYFDKDPPARATAITGLMGSDASVEISLVAAEAPKQVLGSLVSPTLPVSAAVRTGPFVFLSGVVGNTDTNSGDVSAQAREALTRMSHTLESAGLSFGDVVDSTVYLPDLWQSSKMDDVYREFFPKEPPARTLVGAHLVTRSLAVEMVMTAVK